MPARCSGAARCRAELQRLLDEKTDGNPFFVEEVVRSLQESGLLERRGDTIGLAQPTGNDRRSRHVQDVILARLERLDPRRATCCDVAAVIGREFPRRVLERVIAGWPRRIDDRLHALRSAELIQNARVWPEVVYVFRHALTQEVAYQDQTETERQAQHARIGEAIEQVYADRLSEHFGVLAHHFTQAHRWDKALDYLLAAAQQAERTFATREALALYDEALDGGRAPGWRRAAIRRRSSPSTRPRRGCISSAANSSSRAPKPNASCRWRRLTGDAVKEGEALATIAWASTWARNLEAAVRSAREALAVAEPAGALAVQGRAYLTIGFVRGVTGVLDESRAALDKAMALSTAAGDVVHRSLSLSIAGLLRNWAGDYEAAVRLQDEGSVAGARPRTARAAALQLFHARPDADRQGGL